MWILKGTLIGLAVFFIGSVVFVVNNLRPIERDKMTGISAITGPTIHNPWFWAAFVATIILSCVCVKLLQRTAS